jgi:hypothetical protein
VKEVVHPSLINLQSRGGLGWLEDLMNGWFVVGWKAPAIQGGSVYQ